MNELYHIPVLLNQSVDALEIKPDGVYVDATFGGGGHSRLIYSLLSPKGKLIAFDQDIDAHNNAWKADNFVLIQANFRYLQNFVEYLGFEKVDGIIADLGLSTHHIDTPERGFSFRFDAKLDMRMNINQKNNASLVINKYDEKQLTEIFRNYGELRNASQIAKIIVEARKNKPIERTFELVETLKPLIPKKEEHKFLAKVFQAVRMEVNEEITSLKDFLMASCEVLKKDGKLVVISYHSLEDAVVKNFMKSGNFEGVMQKDIYGNIIRPFEPIGKVVVPSEEEIKHNNRARSAKLRIASKI